MILKKNIKVKIEAAIASPIIEIISLSGGCISDAFKITSGKKESFFLKTNSSHPLDMFSKEAHGLQELTKANVIRTPKVISYDDDFILLEFIESGNRQNHFSEEFGRKFALLHKFSNQYFGFYEDNYIGSNPQKNIPADSEKQNWREFYFNKRILFQLSLAGKSENSTSELRKAISKLENKIDEIIPNENVQASLLHGDLWGGNYMVDENGEACLIDPAVYYGDREADLAMTKLFGGFDSNFYAAYNEVFPLSDGYSYRENIYKLYHVLNHLNLFGGGYYSQAMSLIHYYV